MNFKMKQAALAMALVGAFGTAQATVLTPNVLSANVDNVATSFGGTLLDSAITNVSNLSFNGIARSAVYDTGNGLDFYYQFTNNDTSKNGVERFSMFDFSSLAATAIEVFQTASAFDIFVTGTENADYADRTSATAIGFNFLPNEFSEIKPGTTSYTQIIRTNATNYVAGNFGLIDGVADNAAGFAPAVPEPETYAMMLAGLGLIGFIGRRRLGKGVADILGDRPSGMQFA